MIGRYIAHYLIEDELGRGGMGIVYKASDTKLDRTVALKLLPMTALGSEDDRARFYREAKAAAQLHHPHIATVFEIGEGVPSESPAASAGTPGGSEEARPFIAMEYIDGMTLSAKIQQAPLKIAEAVRIASEVAEALKAAHARGVVHRDIKSANVMLTVDGSAKVLDFGLAKTSQSTMLTRQGSTLGTVAYMSPEQARGEEVDGRTDLYALGTVLYEMVAGRLPFVGDYEQAVLYGILNEPPEPLTALRTGVPMGLEFVTNKCLSKDRDLRYQTAADLMADLKSLSLGGSGFSRVSGSLSTSTVARSAVTEPEMAAISAAVPPSGAQRPTAGRGWKAPVVAAIAAATLVAGLAAGWWLKPAPAVPEMPIRKLEIAVDGFAEVVYPTASSDGRYWAFRSTDTTASGGIVMMDTRTGETTMVPGTSGLFYSHFSPSGAELLMQGGGQVYRAAVPGGRPIKITDDFDGGIDWVDDTHIVVTPRAGSSPSVEIVSIADQSRTTIPLTGLDSTYVELRYVRRIGSLRRLVGNWTRSDGKSTLVLIDLDARSAVPLKDGACCASPVGETHLVYLVGSGSGQLVAQAIDPVAGRLTGVPVDLLDQDVDEVGFGVGLDGTLLIGTEFLGDAGESLTWLAPADRTLQRVNLPVRDYDRVSLSPDARLAAIERRETGERLGDIYVMNIQDGTEQRFTYNHPINRVPVWGRDGRIYYAGGAQGQSDVYYKNADGSGVEQLVVRGGDFPSVSEDGKWLAFVRIRQHENLFAVNLETGEEVAVDTTDLKTTDPAISPNGRWIAFSADTQMGPRISQNQQVYVRSFPDPSGLYQLVSDSQGDDPMWSPDGKWLYYRSRGEIFRVAVATEGTFQKLSLPEQIGSFSGVTVRLAVNRRDGRLLVVHPGEAADGGFKTRITLHDGFPRLLNELAPPSR